MEKTRKFYSWQNEGSSVLFKMKHRFGNVKNYDCAHFEETTTKKEIKSPQSTRGWVYPN